MWKRSAAQRLRLLATLAAADLDDHVLAVVGVAGHEQLAELARRARRAAPPWSSISLSRYSRISASASPASISRASASSVVGGAVRAVRLDDRLQLDVATAGRRARPAGRRTRRSPESCDSSFSSSVSRSARRSNTPTSVPARSSPGTRTGPGSRAGAGPFTCSVWQMAQPVNRAGATTAAAATGCSTEHGVTGVTGVTRRHGRSGPHTRRRRSCSCCRLRSAPRTSTRRQPAGCARPSHRQCRVVRVDLSRASDFTSTPSQ